MRIGTLLLAAMLVAVPAAADELDRLAWMAGSWTGGEGKTRSEEHMIRPAGGLILGMHRTVQANGKPFWEFFRIEAKDGAIAYWPSPFGRSPVAFTLTDAGASHAVFENPEHSFPKKILYRRDGDRMAVTVSGPGKDGKEQQESWVFQRASAVDAP